MSGQPEFEPEVIRAAQNGEELAIRLLYRAYTPRLRGVLSRVTGRDGDLTEDLVQDTWIEALRVLGNYRGEAAFGTWLVAIGIRLAWSHHRRHHRRTRLLAAAPPPPHASDPPGFEQADLEQALAALPFTQRMVVTLQGIHGYSHHEVAAMLGITESSSRSALTRARATLRQHYSTGRSDG